MLKTLMLAGLFLSPMACMGYTIPMAGEGYEGPTNPQPGQTLATAIVWDQVFGFADFKAAPVLWHFGDNCIDSRGLSAASGPRYGTDGGFKDIHSGICEYGQYEASGWVETTEFDAPNRIDIEWHGTFSDRQTFAHELCHAYRQYLTGDGDEGHTSNCFVGADGVALGLGDAHEGSLVYAANQALLAAGF